MKLEITPLKYYIWNSVDNSVSNSVGNSIRESDNA